MKISSCKAFRFFLFSIRMVLIIPLKFNDDSSRKPRFPLQRLEILTSYWHTVRCISNKKKIYNNRNIIRKKCFSYPNHLHLLIENSSQNPLKSSNSPIKFRNLISNHLGNKKSRATPPYPSKLLSIRGAQQKHHANTLSAIWFILPEPIETSSRRSRGRSSATGIART